MVLIFDFAADLPEVESKCRDSRTHPEPRIRQRLTYMSIDDSLLRECVRDGSLVSVPPLKPGGRHMRIIMATAKLMGDLTGSNGSVDPRLVADLRADMDTFLLGDPITVGGPKHKKAYMKPMARTRDGEGFSNHEVWEIRSLDPKPAIRVFGRFAKKDVFVATDWEVRKRLGGFGSLEWRREIRRCKHDWRTIFDTRQPHTGAHVDDYISDPVVDLRDP